VIRVIHRCNSSIFDRQIRITHSTATRAASKYSMVAEEKVVIGEHASERLEERGGLHAVVSETYGLR